MLMDFEIRSIGLGINTQVYKFSSQVMPAMGLRKSPSLDTCHGPGWAISGDQWWSVKLWARGERWEPENIEMMASWGIPGVIRVARRGFGDKSWTYNGEWRVSEEDVSPLMMRTVYMYSHPDKTDSWLGENATKMPWMRGKKKDYEELRSSNRFFFYESGINKLHINQCQA